VSGKNSIAFERLALLDVRVEKPREIAVRLLKRQAAGTERFETVLDQELSRSPLAPADRALVQELTFGVIRWQLPLDWLIARKTQGRTQKGVLQILLRLGLYQAFWMDRIPDHALVNESVQLARDQGFGPQSGFINAVLRGCLRERDQLRAELAGLRTRDPHLGYSHPQWLWERWSKRLTASQLQELAEWNNTPAPVYARVNTLLTTPDELMTTLQQEGVTFSRPTFPWVGDGLMLALDRVSGLASLPSFQRGGFYIQDPSTLLAVQELDPQPGERILDLCAAPGGKATYAAQRMQNQGMVVAEDNDPQRLARLQQNCQRLGATCVRLPGQDRAGSPAEPNPSRFDRVLLDAPCSNTGVMRRRVELRWRVQPAEIERLQAAQLKLLRSASARLRPGGTLVYSTCSLEPEENQEVVRRFLEENPSFRLESERSLTPFEDLVDGAFVARLFHKGGG
jgi:16S rRNA (cytosine967-C5)-methyltransferase